MISNKITIDGRRFDLATMVSLGISTHEEGGVRIDAVFFGPRSHRIITESYSIWQRGQSGEIVGTTYSLSEPGQRDWVWEAQFALDHCDPEHDEMIEAALDAHCPAETELSPVR